MELEGSVTNWKNLDNITIIYYKISIFKIIYK